MLAYWFYHDIIKMNQGKQKSLDKKIKLMLALIKQSYYNKGTKKEGIA